MWFKIVSYLSFLIKSNNQHGIHSPFVYKFVTESLYGKPVRESIDSFQKIRQSLFENHTPIEIHDFGQGSKVLKENIRKVSKIAKIAGISKKKGRLLLKLMDFFQPEFVLEIGTSVGLGTSALSLGNKNAKIISLEGCINTANIAKKLFEEFQLNNIRQEIGLFKNTLPAALKNKSFDLIYFDGNHKKAATLFNFEQCLNHKTSDSIFIFDDIYWSRDMKEAWDIIIKNKEVTVSIDIYYWGIVFFRQEQRKQHFTIRV
jgi:predicted O-methyltransferase YrrM